MLLSAAAAVALFALLPAMFANEASCAAGFAPPNRPGGSPRASTTNYFNCNKPVKALSPDGPPAICANIAGE